MEPGGDAGPPATPALPYSTRQSCSCDFPPFLQSWPLVPPCWPPPGQGGSGGHRGVRIPTAPVHIPGDPLRIPTVLVSPWPHCVSPEPLTVSPPPPRCVPCTCPRSPVCVPAALGGMGAQRSPHPKHGVGLGGIRGVWDHPGWGSVQPIPPSGAEALPTHPNFSTWARLAAGAGVSPGFWGWETPKGSWA